MARFAETWSRCRFGSRPDIHREHQLTQIQSETFTSEAVRLTLVSIKALEVR